MVRFDYIAVDPGWAVRRLLLDDDSANIMFTCQTNLCQTNPCNACTDAAGWRPAWRDSRVPEADQEPERVAACARHPHPAAGAWLVPVPACSMWLGTKLSSKLPCCMPCLISEPGCLWLENSVPHGGAVVRFFYGQMLQACSMFVPGLPIAWLPNS